MPVTRLDRPLLAKLSKRLGKPEKYVREQIAKRATRMGVASEAAQILWSNELGIGTSAFQRRLEPHVQQQIVTRRAQANSHLPRSASRPAGRASQLSGNMPRTPSPIATLIDSLLSDDELRSRCGDLLRARTSFDRVFREATVVLDDRLKRLAGIKERINPASLVAKVLHPRTAILIVSENEAEQQGFYEICKGIIAAFRNPAHHSLNDKLTREDALRFCGFIDSLLALLNQARVRRPVA